MKPIIKAAAKAYIKNFVIFWIDLFIKMYKKINGKSPNCEVNDIAFVWSAKAL